MSDSPARSTATAAPPGDTLFRAAGYTLARHRCAGAAGGSREEMVARPEIVFVRGGVFVHRSARGRVVAEPSRALLLNAWEPYDVEHPAGGDDCVTLRLPEAELRDLLRDAGLDEPGDPARPFAVSVASPPVEATIALFALAARVRVGGSGALEPLAIQERMLALARAALGGARPRGSWASRADTRRDHRERVEALRLLLARAPGERHDLPSLARRLHTSAFHLARLFRAETGGSIHRHLVQLRLRVALERLAAGERDLSALAHDLGFADHSHLTRAFRRHLGRPPSALRLALATATI